MICVDANVIIDILLSRKNAAACETYLTTASETLAITTLTLDLVTYYAERQKLILTQVQQFLTTFVWLPVTADDATWSFSHFKGDGYEDGLQIGCAVREQCSRFVTLDRGLAKKYAQQLKIDLLG